MISPQTLSMHGVSRLFPSLRVDLAFRSLRRHGLLTPLTSLPDAGFRRASLAIDEISSARPPLRVVRTEGLHTLPLWINLADATIFPPGMDGLRSGVRRSGFGLASSVASMLHAARSKLTCR
jgi:hypothetical protein